MIRKSVVPMLAMSLLSLPVYSAETHGSISLGYLATSGNSETTTSNAQFELNHTTGFWHYLLRVGANRASEGDETTQERYTAFGKVEYNITEHDYAFGAVDWAKDLFGGIRERTSVAAGYGRRLIDTSTQSLDLEIGAGYRWLQEQKPSLEEHSSAIIRGGLSYLYNFSDDSTFEQILTVESGSHNTHVESLSTFKFTLVENLFAKLSYTVIRNSDVPDGAENTDTYTAISVAYEFES